MKLYITYKTVNNSFSSFEFSCNYRKEAYKIVTDKADFKELHSIIRLKQTLTRFNGNGDHDDTSLKYFENNKQAKGLF